MTQRVPHPRVVEAVIVAALFVSSALWGASYWNASLRAGRQPSFYQPYFEPAVMLACGHGFRLTTPPLPAISSFVQLQRDSFSCSEIPPGVQTTVRGLYQKPWMYLMSTVAFAWRVRGVSWSGLGPLFGVLYGATIVAAYAIFRLGMGRVLSAIGSAVLAVSAVHLQNLPHLRDYAKAPFTLLLFALLGLLVARPSTWKRLILVAAAYGATLGIGYGFRTDFLAEVPLFPITVLAFVPGRLFEQLPAKAAAIGVCLLTFVAVAWPILTSVQERGGCQWHAVLLGLTDGPTDALMISRAPYSFGADFSDDFVYAAATAYAVRRQPDVGHIEYCSHDYDGVTGRYVADLMHVFPADFLTRGLASVIQIVQLPFRWYDEPLPGWHHALYSARRLALKLLRGWGVVPIGIALLGLTAASPRLGLFALFFLFYVGGYPALQFNIRHYFHLEFITWWSIGFVVQHGVDTWRASSGSVADMWARVRSAYDWRRGVRVLGAAAAGVLIALWAARGYQQVSAARLFESYVAAPKQPLRIAAPIDGALHRVPLMQPHKLDPAPAELLEIDVDTPRCGDAASILFAYDRPYTSLAHEHKIDAHAGSGDPTRVFQPIYAGFAGLRFANVPSDCLKGAARVSLPDSVRLLMPVTLRPSWRRQGLFERMAPFHWRW
jgi:hypothetical protein